MNAHGGGGPEGTQVSPAGGVSAPAQTGGLPVACNEVRITNQAGGILECLTFQEACARGAITDSSICTVQTSSISQPSTTPLITIPSSNFSLAAPLQGINWGCISLCGSVLVFLVLVDAIFGTKLIIRRSSSGGGGGGGGGGGSKS